MKTNRLFSWTPVLVSLLLALAFLPVMAQEDEEAEETGFGELYAQIEMWVAQPAGLDYFAATQIDPLDPFNTRPLTFATGTEPNSRYRAGFTLSRNRGGLILTWYAHESAADLSRSTPAAYNFGETLVHPMYAGFLNDGLADGFRSTSGTILRDLRLDYYRTAFQGARVEAQWFVGWRRVSLRRQLEAEYVALITDLPPLISQERPSLIPGTDSAFVETAYSGRGPEAGMDFLMPLWRDKIHLEGGFGVAVLRGNTDSTYRSTTYYYTLTQEINGEATTWIIDPPYDEFDDVDLIDGIAQRSLQIGVQAPVSSTGSVLEVYLGVRGNVWRGLEAFGGFRSARYDGVGIELRPETVTTAFGTNIQDLSEAKRSVTYEGFYAGLAYRF